jgi:hypothetical protein
MISGSGYPEIPKSEFYGTTWDERYAFLSAASECPDIRLADALRTTVYSLVLKTPPEHYNDQYSPPAIEWRAELDRAMRSWAARFHLADVEWVIPMAWNAINTWTVLRNEGNSNPFKWVHLYAKVPKFTWPVWAGLNVSEADYRTYAENEFHRALEEYIAANNEARAKEPNLEMRDGYNPVAVRYTWTALRICLHWSYADIAELFPGPEGVSEQAVRVMVARICQRIGLPKPNLRASRKRP